MEKRVLFWEFDMSHIVCGFQDVLVSAAELDSMHLGA
jgi:hypothetical protein